MLRAPNLSELEWLAHGFGFRDSVYPEPITTLRQIHSAVVREALPPGGDRFDEGDALITQTPGTIVGVRTADCVPVLIVDRQLRAVAAVHAGWRGTAQHIAAAAVRELGARYGSNAENLCAAVGPSIGVCCYEVGPEVVRQLGIPNAAGHRKVDLQSINELQLREAGVGDVWVARECTNCNPGKYFSFRRDKEQAGRMISFVGRKN